MNNTIDRSPPRLVEGIHDRLSRGPWNSRRRPGDQNEARKARTGERPALPRIDPRFARRWVEVRREEGRRRLKVLVAVLAAIAVAGIGVAVVYSPVMKVRHVRISGAGPIPRREILQVAGLSRYKLMADVDTAAIRRRLDAVPGLGDAQVSRDWPGTVAIQVEVRRPVAVVDAGLGAPPGRRWATVDATGRVLAEAAAPLPGVPVIGGIGALPAPGQWLAGSAGPSAAIGGRGLADLQAAADSASVPTGAAAALAVVTALPASVLPDVQTVTAGPGRRLRMAVLPARVASGSMAVDLGDGSHLAQKLTALSALLTEADLSGVASINLTVPDRPAALTAR
ncbi:MAG: cell division protein FtsQ/DivIB [Acidimicrobiales bacterium]